MIFMYSSCSANCRHGEFFCWSSSFFSVSELPLKQKAKRGLQTALSTLSTLDFITENTGTGSTNCHHLLKPLYGTSQQKTSKFAFRTANWTVAEFSSSPFLLGIDPEQVLCIIFLYQELIVAPDPQNTGNDPFSSSKWEVSWMMARGK